MAVSRIRRFGRLQPGGVGPDDAAVKGADPARRRQVLGQLGERPVDSDALVPAMASRIPCRGARRLASTTRVTPGGGGGGEMRALFGEDLETARAAFGDQGFQAGGGFGRGFAERLYDPAGRNRCRRGASPALRRTISGFPRPRPAAPDRLRPPGTPRRTPKWRRRVRSAWCFLTLSAVLRSSRTFASRERVRPER